VNIGIDLGTTNSALAFVEPVSGSPDYPEIKVLEIPQYVAPGQISPRRTLPSFLFLGDQTYVGAYAREQGALVPTKSVHSAKSWLSNPEVDRTAKILPWDAQEGGRVLSPVEVSNAIIAHIRDAWDQAHPNHPLSAQDIVLTVPASFDEEARELTVQAARDAGIEKLTLVEEPAAAFYSWIANHLAQSQKSLFDGQLVLVCDVGGGTSDFTLIRVHRDGDRVEFTRTAVGKHLLLGGDNLDLTLAWLVEAKLGTQLSIRQRSGLRRQCAAAKEKLLADPNLKSVEITVLGAGSSLVGGTLKTEILREEALELARWASSHSAASTISPPKKSAVCFASSACPTFPIPPSRGTWRRSSAANDRRQARRHPLQRRLLHSRNLPAARGRRDGTLVWPAPADSRKSRSGSRGRGGRGLLLLREIHRRRTPGAWRPAARLLCRRRRK
jgi:molecular chaperone DnaK (HSP70)